ncbi:MoaF-related domain-containing protein [Pedobacter lusitanus]|uniref:MoaF-related domain-containing protein n=1 Tax=Pedobacter lusitanus TaxID=1503925 RepID=UPI000697DFF0|nr:MoaF C-terminal domain-containing protein [Pedobacter lusitanus]
MLTIKFSTVSKIFGFLGIAVLAACNTSDTSTDPSVRNPGHELIGETGKITYEKFQAEVRYLNDSTIHWKTVDAKGVVAEESEHVALEKLNDHLYFLNWMEASGLTVSQIINTKDMEVTAYLSYKDTTAPSGRKTEFLHGKFEYITNH